MIRYSTSAVFKLPWSNNTINSCVGNASYNSHRNLVPALMVMYAVEG